MQQDPIELSYRFGLAGAFAPLLLFLAGVTWLGVSGAPGEQGFWPILVGALAFGLLLSRDRYAYAESVIGGMSQPIIMVMILAWLLAGMLAALMNASGFVQALVWLAHAGGLGGAGFVVAAFLISAAVSTSTGTSLGTVILCSPLLYPAGGALEASPAVLIGAILGGATFGDNISPVSDTTIASTVTQGARMGEVVRSRLRYALPAAGLALVAYFFAATWLGEANATGAEANVRVDAGAGAPAVEEIGQQRSGDARSDAESSVSGSASDAGAEANTLAAPTSGAGTPGAEAEPAQAVRPSPAGLPMLLAPLLVVVLLFRHVHLLEGLMSGIAVAIVLGLALGLIQPGELIYVDPGSFAATGILVEGMQRGVGVSIFTILLMGLVAGLESSGVIRRLLAYAGERIDSPRSAEWWSFGVVSSATLLTTHSVVALLAVGPFARETGFRQGITATRRANILDTTVCTYPFLLPYCVPTILAASTTLAGPSFGMPVLPALTVGLFNFHSWALLLMVLFAIATGWGRGRKEDSRVDSIREPSSPWARPGDDDSTGSSDFDLGHLSFESYQNLRAGRQGRARTDTKHDSRHDSRHGTRPGLHRSDDTRPVEAGSGGPAEHRRHARDQARGQSQRRTEEIPELVLPDDEARRMFEPTEQIDMDALVEASSDSDPHPAHPAHPDENHDEPTPRT